MVETQALKLYHAAASPNSRRARMFLAEKGISVPLFSIDLAAGEQHSVPRAKQGGRSKEGGECLRVLTDGGEECEARKNSGECER